MFVGGKGGEEEVLVEVLSRCCLELDCGTIDSGDGYKNKNNTDGDCVEESSMERRSLYDPATVSRCEEALVICNYFHTHGVFATAAIFLMEQKRERRDNGVALRLSSVCWRNLRLILRVTAPPPPFSPCAS